MKKRIFAFLLAALMLVGLCLAGCGEKELTAEEYLRESFKADIEKLQNPYDFDTMKTSIGIGNIKSILDMVQADTANMPAIDDIALDIYSSESSSDIALSALVNNQLCDFEMAFDMGTNNMVLASGLVSETYGISLADMYASLGLGEIPVVDQKALNDSALALVGKIADLIITNSTLAKADGEKGKVIVTADINSEQYAAIAVGMFDSIKEDTVLVDYLSTLLAAYDVDLDEFFAEYEAVKADFPGLFAELGVAMNMSFTIDKKTCVAEAVDGTFTIDGETGTFSASESETGMSFDIAFNGLAVEVAATYDDNGVNGGMTIAFNDGYDDFAIDLKVTAAGGNAELSLDMDGTLDGETLDISAAIAGEYTISENVFDMLLTEISVGGIAIDVSEAEITLTVETDCAMPEIPAATVTVTDFSEEGPLNQMIQEFAINLMLKTGMYAY